MDGISADTKQLLETRISSFEELQILLRLHQDDGTARSMSDIAEHLGIQRDLTRAALKSLEHGRLLESEDGVHGPRFRYAPADATLKAAVDALSVDFHDNPSAILSLMTTNAIDRVRNSALVAFSDAFLLKRGKDDG
jgi:DNA-binding IscR family transcriptional regulator